MTFKFIYGKGTSVRMLSFLDSSVSFGDSPSVEKMPAHWLMARLEIGHIALSCTRASLFRQMQHLMERGTTKTFDYLIVDGGIAGASAIVPFLLWLHLKNRLPRRTPFPICRRPARTMRLKQGIRERPSRSHAQRELEVASLGGTRKAHGAENFTDAVAHFRAVHLGR